MRSGRGAALYQGAVDATRRKVLPARQKTGRIPAARLAPVTGFMARRDPGVSRRTPGRRRSLLLFVLVEVLELLEILVVEVVVLQILVVLQVLVLVLVVVEGEPVVLEILVVIELPTQRRVEGLQRRLPGRHDVLRQQ